MRAISLYSAYNPQSMEFAYCLSNSADLHKDRGQMEAAEVDYLRAIAITGEIGPQDRLIASFMNDL